MKYEIQERSKVDPDIWYTVAWTDVKEYADMITCMLKLNGKEFRIRESE